MAEKVREITEKALGEKHPTTQYSLGNLAAVYQQHGRYAEAEALSQQVVARNKHLLGETHRDTLISMHALAVAYHTQGSYQKAEDLHLQTLALRKKTFGDHDPDTLASMQNLAALYRIQGRYKEAEPLYTKTLQVSKQSFGHTHPHTLRIINGLALLYRHQGRYALAEPLYNKVIAAKKKQFGLSHPSTLNTMGDLAGLYLAQKKYKKATDLYQKILDATEKIFTQDHPQRLRSLNNLATAYTKQKRYKAAEALYLEVLQRREMLLGKDHKHTLDSLHNLASLYNNQQRYQEAEPLFLRAIENYTTLLGEGHITTLSSINNLALLYMSQQRYQQASNLLLSALQHSEKHLGKTHPHTLLMRLNLIEIWFLQQKEPRMIVEQLKRYQQGLLQRIGRELHQEHELADKRRFLAQAADFQNLSYQLALQSQDPSVQQFALEVLLRWEHVNTEEQMRLQHALQLSKQPKIKQLAQTLAASYREMTRMMNDQQTKPVMLKALLQRIQQQEQQLSEHNTTFKDRLAIRRLNVSDIEQALPQNSGLLILRKFRKFKYDNKLSATDYWLAVWVAKDKNNQLYQQFYQLGSVPKSHQHWTRYRHTNNVSDAQTLYEYFFPSHSPVHSHFSDVERLYITTDDFLQFDDLTRWRLPDGRYWIERHDIRRLNTARDLIRFASSKQTNNNQGLIAMGSINYDRVAKTNLTPDPIQTASLTRSLNTSSPQHNKRGLMLIDKTLDNTNFNKLPSTSSEIKHIQRYYQNRFPKRQVQVFTDSHASEYQLKNLQTPPHVLHLATHAFYLKDDQKIKHTLQRPFARSGLALAYANEGRKGIKNENGEDGILYALEALGLNLNGTELVTLSACKTVAGEEDSSEGIYSLMQAFKIAGAKNIIMTLEEVNDRHTSIFMDAFYKNWLKGKNKDKHPAIALRETKLAFITGDNKAYRQPEFWSPFVLVEMVQDRKTTMTN